MQRGVNTTFRREIIHLNEQSCNCKMTVIITLDIGATAPSKGRAVVSVQNESLRRSIALEVGPWRQTLRGAITMKQGTITLSSLTSLIQHGQIVYRLLSSFERAFKTSRSVISIYDRTTLCMFSLQFLRAMIWTIISIFIPNGHQNRHQCAEYLNDYIMSQINMQMWLVNVNLERKQVLR